jgi:cytochrome b
MMSEPSATRRKWDAFVRFSHWAIVAGVIANGFVLASGSQAHIWVGYALGGVLAARLVWGLVGPEAARFSAFPPSLSRAADHIRAIAVGKREEHASHNPLGALMVYAIWFTLSVIVATGVGMAWQQKGAPDAVVTAAPQATEASEEADDAAAPGEPALREQGEREEGALTEIHELAVNVLYALIVLHLAGVFFETRRSGPQIVKSMMP